MTKIIELAHSLGEEIAKSEEIKNLEAAQTAYQTDAELQAWLSEHEADRRVLADEFSKNPEEVDEKAIADLRARIDELTALILANENYTAFANAQKVMNELMTAVNDEIKFVITGVRPDHCTHDCSTCGGCH
ncbi:MAG: YlbF family regulator [Clostridia bacterium]|nr:YlbF family regulator [Clostridia bacterium]